MRTTAPSIKKHPGSPWRSLKLELYCGGAAWLLLAGLALYMYGTGILTPDGSAIGGYLGYDNYYRFTTSGGAWDASHPLINPLYYLNRRGLVPLLGESGALICCLLLTSGCVAAAAAAVCAYLHRIAGLTAVRSLLLSGVFLSTFTALTLSFTIESYPLSLALLSLSLLALSRQLQERKQVSLRSATLWSLLLGGVTLTNFAKPLTAILLERSPRSHKVRKVLIPTALLAGLVFVAGWVYQQRREHPAESMLVYQANDLLRFQTQTDDLWQDFFGHPILISDLQPRTLRGECVPRPTPYKSAWGYAVPVLVVLSFVLMIPVGRRHREALLIPLYLSVDIAVHLIGGYGTDEAIIFGGHWVFLFPLLLGWMCRGVPRRFDPVVNAALLLLMLALLWHNLPAVLRLAVLP